MENKLKKVVLLIGLPLIIGAAGAYLLTGVFGPSDWGLRCARFPVPECRVLQTRFFGMFGNSYFAIPESTIRAARTIHPLPDQVGGRSVTFTVALMLDPQARYPSYPVLSYGFQSQADASTKRLNAYFNDKAIASIEIKNDLLTPLLFKVGTPLLLVAIVLALRWWRLRSKSPAA